MQPLSEQMITYPLLYIFHRGKGVSERILDTIQQIFVEYLSHSWHSVTRNEAEIQKGQNSYSHEAFILEE